MVFFPFPHILFIHNSYVLNFPHTNHYSISQEICTRFLLCCALLWLYIDLIFPYPSGLLYWHCGNLAIAPVPAKQPWWIWINTSCEFIMNDCITTTKQSTTKPCAYFLGYTVLIMSCHEAQNHVPNKWCLFVFDSETKSELLKWYPLTHHVPVMSYDDISLGLQWLRQWFIAWWH